eukprot:203696_1
MNLTRSNVSINVSYATTTTVKYNKWMDRRIETGIGEKIRIKFGNKGISLGIIYYVNGIRKSKFGLSFDAFLKYINSEEVFSIRERDKFIQSYEHTVDLAYLQKNFIHWKDVKDDILWQKSVQTYLQDLKFNILKAIASKKFTQFHSKFVTWYRR